MADQHKTGWWQTIPGFLTAGAAFIAALSGLIAGLSQIGVFDRPEPTMAVLDTTGSIGRADTGRAPAEGTRSPPPAARPRVRPATPAPARPAPVAVPAPDTARPASRDSSTGLAPTDSAPTETDTTAIPDTAAARGDSAAPGDTPADPTVAADSTPSEAPAPVQPAPAAPAAVLPSGTVLELAASNRVCSTTSGEGQRFTAAVVVPVTTEAGVALAVGSTAVLEVLRLPAPTFIGARLDSIVRGDRAVAVRKSETRVRREFVAGAGEEGVGVGACIPAGGRITTTLGAPVRLGASRPSR